MHNAIPQMRLLRFSLLNSAKASENMTIVIILVQNAALNHSISLIINEKPGKICSPMPMVATRRDHIPEVMNNSPSLTTLDAKSAIINV